MSDDHGPLAVGEHAGIPFLLGHTMNAPADARAIWRSSRALFIIAGAYSLTACSEPETFVPIADFSGPAGVIEGTLTYAGPPPCTEKGRIVGAAVVLAFNTKLLPPPDGLGTGAQSLDAIAGELLFSSIRDKLVFAADGSLRCPDSSADPVTASADWAIAPLGGGTYQIRGFYDRDGDFNPAFSISNLPTKGDVGGGAIANAAEVLMGGKVQFTEIDVGVYSQETKQLEIPATGYRVQGIGVTLAQSQPFERPIFYPSAVADTIAGNTDPRKVVLPADFQFPSFPPPIDGSGFIRITYTAGVVKSDDKALDESKKAADKPFFLPVLSPPPTIYMTVEDANRDGIVDNRDSVPESSAVPSLYPLTVFSKILAGTNFSSQTKPRVIIQGLTMFKDLIQTAGKLPMPNAMDPTKFDVFQSFESEVTVALRPAAICIDPVDTSKKGVLLLSHKTAGDGNPILSDEDAVRQQLQRQFGRPFDVIYGCLPEGEYTMNLVYPTGQAWTLPNEAGVCAPAEPMSSDGKQCEADTSVGTPRPRLASQDVRLTVGAPKDANYCKKYPTPRQCRAL